MKHRKHGHKAIASALAGIADGALIALADCPEHLVRVLAETDATGLRLLCESEALRSPAVRDLLLSGHVDIVTRACSDAAADDVIRTSTGKPVLVQWLTYEQMTEALMAAVGGLRDFYSSGEVHTRIRRPEPDARRWERLSADGADFVRKAALYPDLTLLRSREADSFGALRLPHRDEASDRLAAAMGQAATRTVAECPAPPLPRLPSHTVDVPGRPTTTVINLSVP
ncbi:hypothetical protein [Streptomyces sp. GZWMJZ-114]|uniref:hypothetical protein n=1 Tax=Streptomyces sp. GZWMJZ-114 TaxID=2494734 RepID=UPI001013775E|nr:hypothetical protein [Streptomyces sp. GZWMJZ-114]